MGKKQQTGQEPSDYHLTVVNLQLPWWVKARARQESERGKLIEGPGYSITRVFIELARKHLPPVPEEGASPYSPLAANGSGPPEPPPPRRKASSRRKTAREARKGMGRAAGETKAPKASAV
jgi:hypothetical protein